MTSRVGALEIDEPRRCVRIGAREVPLRPLELRLLIVLATPPFPALTRQALTEALWGADAVVDARTVDACVTRIRRAIAIPGAIVTVRRIGYRLDPASFEEVA